MTDTTVRDEKMNFKDVNGVCIIDVDEKSISGANIIEFKRLLTSKVLSRRVAINMKNISTVSHDFLELLKEVALTQKISLINIDTNIYLMLFILKYDQHVNLYLDSNDFIAEKNMMLHRRFKLISAA